MLALTDIFLKLVKDFKGTYSAKDYSYDSLVRGALTCLEEKNGFLSKLRSDDPDNEQVEEILIKEFSKYKKNLGGCVFFTGPEINFGMCEQFLQSHAYEVLEQKVCQIVHQIIYLSLVSLKIQEKSIWIDCCMFRFGTAIKCVSFEDKQ